MKTMLRTFALAAIASLALAGCYKQDPVHRHDRPDDNGGNGGNGGRTEEKIVLNERSDWSIRYVARELYEYDDGTTEKTEHFKMSYKGSGYYIVRMVRPDDFKDPNIYNSDAAALFTYEAESLLNDAKDRGVDFWRFDDEVFTSKITDIFFNRLRSGTWMAFLIELDTNGKVTGNYAEADFTIQEEVATEAFNRWIGDWLVTNGRVGYDLSISSIDNNFIYRIDGWERGDAVSFQMDQEYLEGEFWEENGFLYIMSQYLGTYEDTDFGHGKVDELFMGNIFDSGGLTLITDEGLDLAVMVPGNDGTAELQPMEVTLSTANGDYTTTFHSMQYYMWAYSNGEWYAYNNNVAALPLTMIRQSTRSAGVMPAKERGASRASIHHSQPKVGKSARNSVAKKAVRMK